MDSKKKREPGIKVLASMLVPYLYQCVLCEEGVLEDRIEKACRERQCTLKDNQFKQPVYS
jgi:hypothetical protein